MEPSEYVDYSPEDNIDALNMYNAKEEAEQDPVYWITSAGSILANIQEGHIGSIEEVQYMLTKAINLCKQ